MIPFSANYRTLPSRRISHAPACPSCGCVQYEDLPAKDTIINFKANISTYLDYSTIRCRLCRRGFLFWRINYETQTCDVGDDRRLLYEDI